MRARRWAAVGVAALLATAGCGAGDEDPAAGASGPAGAGSSATGPVTVLAAASLTESFTAIGTKFEQLNPALEVTFSFGGSSGLAQQIVSGAPADVFAAAGPAPMKTVTDAGDAAGTPVTFVRNQLVIAVPKGNPGGVEDLSDLGDDSVTVVLCAPEVPCGKYAKQILDTAAVAVTPVSLEQNVKGVVTKVTAGEADAGIVYTTDVKAAGDAAEAVGIPAEINVIAQYPIASVKTSTNQEVDQAFIDFLLGDDGQAIMAKYGFGAP